MRFNHPLPLLLICSLNMMLPRYNDGAVLIVKMYSPLFIKIGGDIRCQGPCFYEYLSDYSALFLSY